ncbi:hypothetical protein N9N67_07265 [Bacteriovoracaceae bacterium]|nr:hypothetical protein [Bacteriovoracaceae bacterium]
MKLIILALNLTILSSLYAGNGTGLNNFDQDSSENIFDQIQKFECGFSNEHEPEKKWKTSDAFFRGLKAIFKKHPKRKKYNKFKRHKSLSRDLIDYHAGFENSCENVTYLFQNTIKNFTPKLENSLTFNNHCPNIPDKAIKGSGFCWGYASLEQKLLRLASFDSSKQAPATINSEEWISFYEEKIASVLENNFTIIPGFKNLREFSSNKKIEWMLKKFMILTWTNEAHHPSGLKGSKFKGWELGKKKEFFEQTIELLDLGFTPLVLQAKGEGRKNSHVLVAWEYFRKNKETVICLRDPNKTYLFDRACRYKAILSEDEEDYESTSSFIITHNQMRDFYWQYHSLKTACEENRLPVETISEIRKKRKLIKNELADNKQTLRKRIEEWKKYNNVNDLKEKLLSDDAFLADIYFDTFATTPEAHPEIFKFKKEFIINLIKYFNRDQYTAEGLEYLELDPMPTNENKMDVVLFRFLGNVRLMIDIKKHLESSYSQTQRKDETTIIGRTYSFLLLHLGS